jgi:DNA polymerase I-like protein with 3'-5' exonuclease and polymerase domains
MSCSDPNLQQIPRGAEYRRCFVARPGHVLVSADYSQVELRIAVKVTGDRGLTAAYQAGEDVHRKTAARFLKVPVEQVTDDARQMSKPVNFGAIYGLGPDSLRRKAKAEYGIDMTQDQARSFLGAFFAEYPAVRTWHGRLRRGGAGEVRTLGGRRIAVEPDGFYGQKANYIVQGTGGDGIKRALGLLSERRVECPTARPVLAIYDEIVLEVPDLDAGTAAECLRRCMNDAMAPLLAPVPVQVEVAVGRTWANE